MRRITLSFDNGPDPEVTPTVLDTLGHHDIKATFFVVGSRLANAQHHAERAHAEGHWIGNHTWSHSFPFRDRGDAGFIQKEIDWTQAEIGSLTHPDRLFRPYGGGGRLDGALNTNAVSHLKQGGYSCILWNAVPGDWKNQDGWVETALQQAEAVEWPLIVLHDIHAVAMRHLDGFIGTLKDRGFAFEQDFPPACVALRRGLPTDQLTDALVQN